MPVAIQVILAGCAAILMAELICAKRKRPRHTDHLRARK